MQNGRNQSNRRQKRVTTNRNIHLRDKKQDSTDSLPPIRQNGSIQVNYTPRVFLTPSRESTEEQENEVSKNFIFMNAVIKNKIKFDH